MSPLAVPCELSHPRARLVPLAPSHLQALAAAVADGKLWQLWYTSIPSPDGMQAEIDRRLGLQAAGTMAPFTIIDPVQDRVVGMTSYLHIDPVHRRLEIGSTWIARSAQRSGLNTAAKLLLLSHAFDTLDCIAVELRTHRLNQQSRRAIERLGAQLDGIFRHHQIMADGTLRDTCVYSIIAPDWPAVRANLRWQLDRAAD